MGCHIPFVSRQTANAPKTSGPTALATSLQSILPASTSVFELVNGQSTNTNIHWKSSPSSRLTLSSYAACNRPHGARVKSLRPFFTCTPDEFCMFFGQEVPSLQQKNLPQHSGEGDLGPARGACHSPLRIHARSSANSSLTCGDAFVRPTASHISWVAVLTFASETCGI